MNFREKELRRSIAKLNPPTVTGEHITSYQDFIKKRDLLPYSQFNTKVFLKLLNLTIEVWNNKGRVGRLSLVQTIRRYIRKSEIKLNDFDFETKLLVFNIFQKANAETEGIGERQLREIQITCNSLLIGLVYTPTEEQWLCDHAKNSKVILNRVLRYPVKSMVISQWAKQNYNKDFIRARRAEIIGRILDEDVHFEVENSTLVDDFEYFNQQDAAAIEKFDVAIETKRIWDSGHNYLNELKKTQYVEPDISHKTDYFTSIPDPQLSQRFYPMVGVNIPGTFVSLPDFVESRKSFHQNIDNLKRITMIWAVAYSHLDSSVKTTLIQKYYTKETYYSIFKVGKKYKLLNLLEWLLEQEATKAHTAILN